MDSQDTGVLAYTYPGYEVITANSEALRMFGCENIYQLQERFNLGDKLISYQEPETIKKLEKLRTEDGEADYGCILNKGKPNECYVIVKSKIIYSPNGRRIAYSTLVDASQNHALQEVVDGAQLGNKAKSEFLFNISHDLRTPMNAIIGYTELLQSHWQEDEYAKKYLFKIINSAKFLMFLLNNAVELSSLEKGYVTVKESLANVKRFNDMLDSVIENSLEERKIKFTRTVNIEHNNIMTDSTKLRAIFLNILSNSIKYTPEGGSISMDLQEIPSQKEHYAMFKTVIKDTGIGIGKDFLPHVYEDFFREKNTTVSGVLGVGLGLSVTKKLVEILGGSIDIQSTVGEGTTVTVIMPHRIVEKEEVLSLTKNQSKKVNKIVTDKRILLAEDNDLNAEIAVMILSDEGFECERVNDGKKSQIPIFCHDRKCHG